MPNSSRECAICHIRWVEAFDRAKPQAGRMDEVLERQAGSGDMCLSCHDGSVTDSRFKIWSTRHHTTDSVPSAAVNIPTEIFPLDSQGRMTCATCHTAHAVPESSDLRTVIFLRKPNVDSSLCLSCHPEHAAKNDFQHPLGDVDYSIPQEILDAGGKTSEGMRTIICQTCHEPHGARNAWMLVLPPSRLCITCHEDKSPETNPPAGAPIHHIGRAYPGFEPPEALLEEKATFGSNGELSCLSCHRLHDASGAKPLLIRKNEDSSLCLDCHPKEKAVLDSPHDLRTSSPQTVNAGGQTALESGPCGACHRIHGWARDVPETNRPHSSACMECHQTGGPGSLNRPYVDAHAVGTPLPENMPTPSSLPLEEGTRNIGCLTCHDPHSPYKAEGRKDDGRWTTKRPMDDRRWTIDDEKTDGSRRTSGDNRPSSLVPRPSSIIPRPSSVVSIPPPRSFLRHEGSQLCVLCHEKLTDLPGQPHDPAAFGPAARDTLALHPSIGPCRVCHTTHSAQGPHLWARTPASDAGRLTDLCGACHGDKLGVRDSVHDTETAQWAKDLDFISKGSCMDCHPVHDPNEEGGVWAFVSDEADTLPSCEKCHRAGGPGQAMQSDHIGKSIESDIGNLPENMVVGPDGRIRCTTCHDIHQNRPMDDGRWTTDDERLFTRPSSLVPRPSSLLVAPIPNLCGICHEDKLGIVESIHDPGTAQWAKDLGFVSKGSCIDCHPIHDAPGRGGIWATIRGDGARQQSCENCHRAGAPGPAMETPHVGKIPGNVGWAKSVFAHAEQPRVQQVAHPTSLQSLPANMKVNSEGQILCATCHDIHQKEQSPKLIHDSSLVPRDSSSDERRTDVCLVCHLQAGRIIGTPHDLRASAPDARNVLGETAAESGPCGSCHLVHHSSEASPEALRDSGWAQGSIFHGKYGSGLCTSCHREGRCASARIPECIDHPDVALVNRTHPGDPDYMPTFDKQGEPSRTGSISCLTCHEPHSADGRKDDGRWTTDDERLFTRPSSLVPRPSSLLVARPSFLRPGADRGICIDCHGTEALWRFLYYHKERRNPHAVK